MMDEDKKIKDWARNPFLWIGVISVVIILVIVGALIFNYWHNFYDEQITISDIDLYDNTISDDNKNELYKILYRVAKINSPEDFSSETLSSASANVREGSFTSSYSAAEDLYVNEFIADIPDLEQSYRIYYNRTGDLNAIANCLLPSEYIYPFYLCLGTKDDLDKTSIEYLDNILPFTGETESGVPIYVGKLAHTNLNNAFVRIKVNSCGDSKIMDAGVEIFKKYLTEHYLNLDDYTYKIKNGCDGEA